jgi:endonuclease G
MYNDPFQMQRELRYGAPVCDQVLTGRYFTIGYSWYFRQAKWVLEIINRERQVIKDLPKYDRLDNFRADLRIPPRFRAGLNVFRKSNFDRGHLAPAANHNFGQIVNSETFLLSNMSPQVPDFNRGMWADLESAVRQLDAQDDIFETYVLTCPVFYFEQPVTTIGKAGGKLGIDLPVPHAFIKSVLAEDKRGALKLWTFEMKNQKLDGKLSDYLVSTYDAEQIVGGRFWDRVSGGDLHNQKKSTGEIWDYLKKPGGDSPAGPTT